MTEPQKLSEIQGLAITEALRQLDRATTMAWKAVNMLGVTDNEWELVKREIGVAAVSNGAGQGSGLVMDYDSGGDPPW